MHKLSTLIFVEFLQLRIFFDCWAYSNVQKSESQLITVLVPTVIVAGLN